MHPWEEKLEDARAKTERAQARSRHEAATIAARLEYHTAAQNLADAADRCGGDLPNALADTLRSALLRFRAAHDNARALDILPEGGAS